MESARSDILRFVDLYVSKSTIQEPGKFERGKMKFVSVPRELSKFEGFYFSPNTIKHRLSN